METNGHPIDVNHKVGTLEISLIVNKKSYQMLVGKLICLFHTRPNIVFAFEIVNQFMHSPNQHMNAVIRILRCPKGAPRRGLLFSKTSNLEVEAYIDAI